MEKKVDNMLYMPSRKYKEIKNLFSYDRNKKNRNPVCDI